MNIHVILKQMHADFVTGFCNFIQPKNLSIHGLYQSLLGEREKTVIVIQNKLIHRYKLVKVITS